MKRIVVFFITIVLVSCGSSRVITSKQEQKKYGKEESHSESTVSTENNASNDNAEYSNNNTSPKVNQTPINTTDKVAIYIHKYKDIAQYEMKHSGIPASITLAQGILESGAGNGDLTRRANNHFGIKCHNWSGEKVYHDDDKKGECFRKYNNPATSFKDHSAFLTSRKRYAFLFDLKKTDYKSWAKGLRKAGYATDPKYPSKLISLIERYQLYNYDKDYYKRDVVKVVEEPIDDIVAVNEEEVSVVTNNYQVQKGDTLYSISKKFNLTVEKLMQMNNLKNNALNIGQQLIVR